MDSSALIIALLPVLVSLVLILSTRRTILSLLLGALLGAVLLHYHALGDLIPFLGKTIWSALSNPWHYSALIFTILLGGFASLLQAGGGLSRIFQNVKTKRGLEVRVIGLGFLCFFDGLANSLLLGRLVRPVADKVGVSREKLAYLADTTASAVACLAPVSTWIAMQLGLISVVINERGLELSPYSVFLKSIPFNFYCLFSLALAFILSATGKDYGAMKKAIPVRSDERIKLDSRSSLIKPLVAIGILLLSIPVLYYIFEEQDPFPLSISKVIDALGGGSGPKVFIVASTISLLALYLLSNHMTFKKRASVVVDGMRQMLAPLGVLVCAWLFGGVLKEHELGKHLSMLLSDSLSLPLLPLLTFLLGCLLSFTTGTSWGTMALLFPIAFGFMAEVPDESLISIFPILVAAIFSGAVFGDHCSPYSDTTIVSSVAAGCSTYAHVKTQLPYALICGGLASIFFIAFGYAIF